MNPDAKIMYTGPSPRGWHRLQLAAECLQKYSWAAEAKKKEEATGGDGKKSPALVKGQLIHLALAQHYARMRAGCASADDWVEAKRAVDLISQLEGTTQYAQVAIDAYEAYVRQYPDDHLRWKILEVEELMDVQIAGRYRLTGRADLVVEDLGGRIWVIDHKCLPGDEEVGGVTVRELYERGQRRGVWSSFPVCSMNKEQHLVEGSALAPVNAGVQNVHEVKLKNGTSLRLGYRHPVWARRGDAEKNRYETPTWVQADQLAPGDEVAVGLGAAVRRNIPSPVTDMECWMAGALVADGSLTNEDFKLTKDDPVVRSAYMDAARKFGFDVAERDPLDRTPYVAARGGELLTSWAARIGLDLVTSPHRRIPKLMRSLCQSQTGQLLGALWSGDGAVYTSKPRSGKPIPRITYGTRSKELARDVQQALLAMGIPANVQTTAVTYKGEKRPYYYATVVTRYGKERFCRLVLDGVIPLVRAAEPVEDVLAAVLSGGAKGDGKIEGELWWVKVQSNTFDGREQCFDIEVPSYHTFLVRGVVTHNSTARLTARHKQFYAVSGQLLGYSHMARVKYGDRFAGLIVNLIQHGTPKFERITLPRSPSLEARFERIVVDIEESIERVEAEGRDPGDWPKAINELTCYHRYGACDFINKCRWGATAGKAGDWEWGGV